MMKNLLLILFLFTVGISSGQVMHPAQGNAQVNSLDPKPAHGYISQPLQQRVLPVDIVAIGSASNMWTVINADQSQVDYNPELGLLTFVHRQNVDLHPVGGSGTVRYDMSTDQGATWTVDNGPMTPQMVSGNGSVPVESLAGEAEVTGPRYPNGIIYNPPGNQDVANAYYVAVGPCQMALNGGAPGWGLTYQSSQKLDGSAAVDNYPVHFDDDVLGPGDGTPSSLCQAGEAVHALGADATTNGEIAVLWKGVLNGDASAFDWTATDIVPPLLRSGSTNMAFSPDGDMGYFVIGGADPDEPGAWFIPNVYSTSDNGDSWALASADLDIANTEVGGLLSGWAYTRNFDCVVDFADNLHVFCEIMQASEDASTWSYAGYMVDFVWDGTDWTEHIIGQIDDTDDNGFANNTFQDQHTHPQASISADGIVATFIWTSSLDSEINDQPDIFGRAMNTTNGEMTPIKNLTEDTEAEAVSFYPTASSTLITDGDDMFYEIPIVLFVDWTGNNVDPVQFFYLKGVGFDLDEFVVGVDEQESPLMGLMLYPNPANNVARLTFGVDEVMDAQIRVIDALGRVQFTVADPSIAIGQHNYDLDVSSLASGLYTIEIIADKSSTTMPLQVSH